MIAILALAAQASAIFAPPVDRPIRVTGEIVRTDNGVTRRFVSTRRIVFRRDGANYRAEVTIEPGAAPPADDDPAAMFASGIAQMGGRTIVLMLDREGRVTAVEALDAAWQAMLDGIAGLAPTGTDALSRNRAGRVRAIAAMLRQQPAERRTATLASLVTILIAAEIAGSGPVGAEPVQVPAASAFGGGQLHGVRAVRTAGEMLLVTVSAAGEVKLTGRDGAAEGRMTLESTRHVDPRTGMVHRFEQTVRTLRADGTVAAERVQSLHLD